MPVVHVRALESDVAAMTAALPAIAAAVASAVPCALDDVWCTMQPLAAETIGERRIDREGRIVYVDVWLRPRGDADAPGRALQAACVAAAGSLGVPLEDVWGALHRVEPGSTFAGGALVE